MAEPPASSATFLFRKKSPLTSRASSRTITHCPYESHHHSVGRCPFSLNVSAQDSLDKSLKADPCILMPDAKKAKWISFELQSGDGLQEILTARELEAFIRLDVKTIYARVQSGRIPYVRMGSSIRFLPVKPIIQELSREGSNRNADYGRGGSH